MKSTDYLDLLSDLIQGDIQEQLLKQRPSRGYNGLRKPQSGLYSTPINNRVNTGRLYNSVKVDYVTTPEGDLRLRLSFDGAPEWRFVDQGRRGKQQNPALKYPPLSTILNWTVQRGLPQFRDKQGRFVSNRTRAFLVQRSIGEYGIFPTNFIKEGIDQSREKVIYYLGLYGKTLLEDFIQKKIIIVTNIK